MKKLLTILTPNRDNDFTYGLECIDHGESTVGHPLAIDLHCLIADTSAWCGSCRVEKQGEENTGD
jgi:hypothetical protein